MDFLESPTIKWYATQGCAVWISTPGMIKYHLMWEAGPVAYPRLRAFWFVMTCAGLCRHKPATLPQLTSIHLFD